MSALEKDEILPGVVGWLDQPALNSDQAVVKSARFLGEPEPRPFVCIEAGATRSTWAPITTAFRTERLAIPPNWRRGGGQGWRTREEYLVDGANTYSGPSDRFIAASADDYNDRSSRMRVSAEGLKAIRAEVQRQRNRRRPGT